VVNVIAITLRVALSNGAVVILTAERCDGPDWFSLVPLERLPTDYMTVSGFARVLGLPVTVADVRQFTREIVGHMVRVLNCRVLIWICGNRDARIYQRLLPREFPGCCVTALLGSRFDGQRLAYDHQVDEQIVMAELP